MYQRDLRRACGLADKLLEIVEEQDDDALRLEAHHCQWATRFLTGDLAAALDHSQLGIKHYRAGDHQAQSKQIGDTAHGHLPGKKSRNVAEQVIKCRPDGGSLI
jgi:hypothetical protein